MFRTMLFIFSTVLLISCSGEENETGDHVWKDQTDTLDKARGVEQTIQESFDRDRQKIDSE